MRTYFGGKQNQMGAKEKYNDLYYVAVAPSKPPHMVKYRSEDKDGFLFGEFRN